MTAEIRKQIDGLSVITRANGHNVHEDCIKKSDVIELVEKLTKWNKVEDCLPDYNGEPVLVRFKLGITAVCIMRYAHDNNDDEPDYYFEYASYGLGYVNDEAIEWKPII